MPLKQRNQTNQFFRTFLSILADLNNAVGWIVSTCSLISKSSSAFTNPLGIVQNAPFTINITHIQVYDFSVLLEG